MAFDKACQSHRGYITAWHGKVSRSITENGPLHILCNRTCCLIEIFIDGCGLRVHGGPSGSFLSSLLFCSVPALCAWRSWMHRLKEQGENEDASNGDRPAVFRAA